MAIITPDQGSVELERRSRISPADTYVRPSIPDVSTGFEQLSKALAGLGANLESGAQQQKAEQDQLDAQKIPYWVNQFSQELDSGVVDETQIGKRLPTQSKLVVAKVLEGIGARQYEAWGRSQFDEVLRGDPEIANDPVKRQAFFDGLRKQVAEQTQGRDFYGAGASRAVEGLINEYEGNFQRQGAAQYQKDQEDQFKQDFSKAIRYGQAAGERGALLDFIGTGESGGNYNAYYGNGNNTTIKFTNMSVGQVLDWQAQQLNKPGNVSSAVGKYQFVRSTLRGLVNELGIDPSTQFTPELQDKLATALLYRRGLKDYEDGKISKEQFAYNLSQEFASLPNPKTGRSFYDGDGINYSQVPVNGLFSAIDQKGQSPNAGVSVDSNYGATSSIPNTKRRTVMVETSVDTAITQRDPSVLDRFEKDFGNILTAEDRVKLEKARVEIGNLQWNDYTRSKQLNEDQQKAEMTQWENDIVTRVAKNQPIDLYKDSLGSDGQVDAKKREFLVKMQESSNVSQADSSLAANNLKDGLFTAATGGNYSQLFGNDLKLGPVVQAGKTPSPDQIRDYIRRRMDINPADKEKLLGEVDTLMEGMTVIRDPIITTAYKEGIGQDVDAFIKNPANMSTIMKNPNLASDVQASYMNVVKREVQASIEDGQGIPRGRAKLDIIEKAEKVAKERLAAYSTIKTASTPQATPQKVDSKASKGRWEMQPNGVKKWIPE